MEQEKKATHVTEEPETTKPTTFKGFPVSWSFTGTYSTHNCYTADVFHKQ